MSWTDRIPASTRRRLRVVAWRTRRPVAALCAGLAVLLVVEILRPPDPPTVEVAVAARDLAAGGTLSDADVVWRRVPTGLVPAGLGPAELVPDSRAPARRPGPPAAAERVADLAGRRLAVDVPAGLPLAAELLVDEDAAPPPGTVVVPVRFADAGVAGVLRAGMRVDVVASGLHDGAVPERLAHGALVLGAPGTGYSSASADEDTSGDGLLGGGARGWTGGTGSGTGSRGAGGRGGGTGSDDGDDSPVLLAVSPEESVALGGASGSRALGAVIVG
jgi:hypothetical protein